MPGPEVVIEPNLLLNLAGLRQPTDRRKHQDNRQRALGPSARAAPYVDLPRSGSSWTTETDLRAALQSTKNIDGLLLKQETDEAQKLNNMVDGMLSKAAKFQPKPVPCEVERRECISCLTAGGGGTDTLLQCSKYVDAYESCVSRVA